MATLFYIAGKIVASLMGLAMLMFGGIWILQGLNIAFLEGSFMAGDPQWAVYGAILAALGLLQLSWSVTRKR